MTRLTKRLIEGSLGRAKRNRLIAKDIKLRRQGNHEKAAQINKAWNDKGENRRKKYRYLYYQKREKELAQQKKDQELAQQKKDQEATNEGSMGPNRLYRMRTSNNPAANKKAFEKNKNVIQKNKATWRKKKVDKVSAYLDSAAAARKGEDPTTSSQPPAVRKRTAKRRVGMARMLRQRKDSE